MLVTEDMVKFHLASMRHQMGQLYHALGLALALNRTLIMPPLRWVGWGGRAACCCPAPHRPAGHYA
jgi:hypothetical protein